MWACIFQEDLVYGMRKTKFPNPYVKMSGFGSWTVVGASDFGSAHLYPEQPGRGQSDELGGRSKEGDDKFQHSNF
jgi:hypothetical protein